MPPLFIPERGHNFYQTPMLAWVADPIEGTYNYQTGGEYWGTQVALLKDGVPVVSVINEPVLKQTYWGMEGGGAFMNGKSIRVSNETDLMKALVSTERGVGLSNEEFCKWLLKLGNQVKRIRTSGATGPDMARVARGVFEIYVGLDSADYDYVPGALLVREAGGRVLNLKGEDWKFGERRLICGSEQFVEKLLKVLH